MKKIIIYFLGIFVGTNSIAVGAFASVFNLYETAKKEVFEKYFFKSLGSKKKKTNKIDRFDRFSRDLHIAALLVIDKIENTQAKISALDKVAYSYSCFFDREHKVLEIVDRQLEILQEVTKLEDKTSIAIGLASRYKTYGFLEKADLLYDRVLENFKIIQEKSRKYPHILDGIISYYYSSDRVEKVLQIIELLKEGSLQRNLAEYNLINIALIEIEKEDKIDRNRDIVREINNNPFDETRLLNNKLTSEEKQDRALHWQLKRSIILALKSSSKGEAEKTLAYLEEGLEIIENFKNNKIKNSSLITLALTYVYLGEQNRGIELLATAWQQEKLLAAEKIELYPTDKYIDNKYRIINIFVWNDRPKKALKLIQEILNSELTENNAYKHLTALKAIAEKFGDRGAIETFNKILEQAEQIVPLANRNILPINVDLLGIAKLYQKYQEPEKAKAILEQVLEANKDFFDSNRDSFLGSVADIFIDLGEYDRALELGLKVKNEPSWLERLIRLSIIYAELGNEAKVFEIIHAISSPIIEAEIMTQIAIIRTKKGDEDKGWELLEKALEKVENYRFPYEPDPLIKLEYKADSIGQNLHNYLDITENKERVLDWIKNRKDPILRNKILLELSNILGNKVEGKPSSIELIDESLAEAKTIKNSRSRAWKLNQLVTEYAEIKEYDRALSVASEIKNLTYQSRAFIEIARIYNQNKDRTSLQTQENLKNIITRLKNNPIEQ